MNGVPRQAFDRATTILRGFTPRRIKGRFNGPRVFANSVPKSGTNLLTECLFQFPMLRPCFKHVSMNQNRIPSTEEFSKKIAKTGRGQYTTGHVFYSRENAEILKRNDIISLLIVRDPRDIVTSHYHYVTDKNPSHRLHDYYNALDDDETRLMASIQGVSGEQSEDGKPLESIGEWMDRFLGWTEPEYTHLVRFEDLIGPQGGGDKESQLETVRSIADHLEVSLSEEELYHVADNTFSTGSSTFRKGLIGDWENSFGPEHVAAFKDQADDWLIELGYEDDSDWGVK
ncbi:hypothetical protein EXE48_07595 [Halorubrum sp. ASP1]|uniref:sulfotransferase domain-containing protein n=1 Tax=Halorubrum sp. ASP1 TaxID=2518114 RepID=UPI0010F7A2D7|nr:sulfotransferase domain-containing protein [Halorubrum sp. ASP1]TKX61655.1 hypothetical protein EXE48_07595 [Halorubrum sp. ASP1]